MSNRFNLSLTIEAKERVLQRRRNCEDHVGQKVIAAIVYLEKSLNPELRQDGLGLAFYYETQRKEIEDDISNIDGLELIVAIPEHVEKNFFNNVIIIQENHLALRDQDVPSAE